MRRPRWSVRLNSISIPSARRLPAIRRSAVPSALGVFGHRTERFKFSLSMLFQTNEKLGAAACEALLGQRSDRFVERRGFER